MAKKGWNKGEVQACKMDTTPMIDVVFQLLLFFMIVSEMKKTEAEAISLPFAVKAIDDLQPPPDRVTINILKTGQIKVGGHEYVHGLDTRPLQALLTKGARLHMVQQDPPISDLPVKIRADAETEYKYVQQVMVACMRSYCWNVSFGASPTQNIPY